MDPKQLFRRRLIVALFAGAIALAAWYAGRAVGWIDTGECVSERKEERDASGKVTRITRKECRS